jgi:hypothetical protein
MVESNQEEGGPAVEVPPWERDALNGRRDDVGVPRDAPVFGLALSGGGIRSATFCLGVLRSLAKNGVLHRFDYLSTVSGGGYIGSAFGRLFNNAGNNGKTVEKGVATDSTGFLWWLRSNGRFLAPAGQKDLLQAWSGHFRGFISTQTEVALIATLIACAVTLPHLVYAATPFLRSHLLAGGSIWWWIVPFFLAWAATGLYGYWFLGPPTPRAAWTAAIATCGFVALLAGAYFDAIVYRQLIVTGSFVLLAPVPYAYFSARRRSAFREDANRVYFNQRLAAGLKLSLLVALAGATDLASWYAKYAVETQTSDGSRLLTAAAITSFLLAVARGVLPVIDKTKDTSGRLPWGAVAQFVGYFALAAIVVIWSTLLQLWIFPEDQGSGMWIPWAWARWGCVVVLVVLFLSANAGAVSQLNRSSLHLFYRSRLARTYVAVGNRTVPPVGKPRFPVNILRRYKRKDTENVVKVTELMDGDDVPMAGYTPHAFGGPIHLINCCVNQTVDDRTGNYNADRKGMCLTVSALGLETGTHFQNQPISPGLAVTTLARWVAISGAAIGSGMGSLTRSGTAALFFLSGLRLGFWQRNLETNPPPARKWPAKYKAMFCEIFAHFPGVRSPDWYLSDGGQFDNTGVYALLKREPKVIVLADCGADPTYAFADVENLVRKARIDYDASIDFVDPLQLQLAGFPAANRFGTPNSISADAGEECFLLARIRYESGCIGWLLVIKPRLRDVMTLDLAGFADQNPDFPQQSTGQQFFSESQWESYMHLGELLAEPLNQMLMAALPAFAPQVQPSRPPDTKLSATAPPFAPSRHRLAATVGTSVGLGAVLTALVTGWQAFSSERAREAADDAAQAKRAVDISSQISDLDAEVSTASTFGIDLRHGVDAILDAHDVISPNSDLRAKVQRLLADLRGLCNQSAASDAAECATRLPSLTDLSEPPESNWSKALDIYLTWRDQPAERVAVSTEPAQTVAVAEEPAEAAPPPAAAPPPQAAPPPPMDEGATTGSAAPAIASREPSPELASPASAFSPPNSTAPKQTQQENRTVTRPSDAEVTAACGRAGQPFTVYTQIYDEQSRSYVSSALSLMGNLGLIARGIENVTATAAAKGRPAPFEWRQPAVIYGPGGAMCAKALAAWTNEAIPQFKSTQVRAVALPAGTGKSGIIELWVPRNLKD